MNFEFESHVLFGSVNFGKRFIYIYFSSSKYFSAASKARKHEGVKKMLESVCSNPPSQIYSSWYNAPNIQMYYKMITLYQLMRYKKSIASELLDLNVVFSVCIMI